MVFFVCIPCCQVKLKNYAYCLKKDSVDFGCDILESLKQLVDCVVVVEVYLLGEHLCE